LERMCEWARCSLDINRREFIKLQPKSKDPRFELNNPPYMYKAGFLDSSFFALDFNLSLLNSSSLPTTGRSLRLLTGSGLHA
jgi:hypothetical protein